MTLDYAEVGQNAHAILSGYSLEMTTKDIGNLEAASGSIPPGTGISVTYLPGDEIEGRVNAAVAVRHSGFSPIPHISARRIGATQDLELFLNRLRSEAGIDRAFVIAGDPPQSQGPYEDALGIIDSGLLAKYGVKTVGIAGYPEGHPQISDSRLQQALEAKIHRLADLGHDAEIVTQFAFDADPVIAWITKIRAAGITAPVRIGVPGPASIKTLLRFAARCGVGASAKIMTKYGVSITKLLNTAGPDVLIRNLEMLTDQEAHGSVKLHFYPFGGLKKTAEWACYHQTGLRR